MKILDVRAPTSSEIDEHLHRVLVKAELEFWRERAMLYANELERMFDTAEDGGQIFLHRRSEKVELKAVEL